MGSAAALTQFQDVPGDVAIDAAHAFWRVGQQSPAQLQLGIGQDHYLPTRLSNLRHTANRQLYCPVSLNVAGRVVGTVSLIETRWSWPVSSELADRSQCLIALDA